MATATRCPRCGAENAPGLKFCGSCGMALTQAPPPGALPPAGPPPAGPPPYVPYAPRRGTGPLVAVIVVVAVLVVGGAAVAFFLLRDDPSGTADPPVTPVESPVGSPVEPTQPADRVPESSLDELLPTEAGGYVLMEVYPMNESSPLEYGATDQIQADYQAPDGTVISAFMEAFPDPIAAGDYLAFKHEYWLGQGFIEVASFEVINAGTAVGRGYQVEGIHAPTGTLTTFFYWTNANLEVSLSGPQPQIQPLFEAFPL